MRSFLNMENETLSQITVEQLEKLCKKNERLILVYNKFTEENGVYSMDLKRVHKIKKISVDKQ